MEVPARQLYRRCRGQCVMLCTPRQSAIRRSYESNPVVDLGPRVLSQIIRQAEVFCAPISSTMYHFPPQPSELRVSLSA
jgi:hypothetical protein